MQDISNIDEKYISIKWILRASWKSWCIRPSSATISTRRFLLRHKPFTAMPRVVERNATKNFIIRYEKFPSSTQKKTYYTINIYKFVNIYFQYLLTILHFKYKLY